MVGKLRRAHPRYTPDSTLAPGSSRWGKATAVLDTLHSVQWRVEELLERMQTWPCARRVGYKTYRSGRFIHEAHCWNVQCQKLLTKQNALHTRHATLCQDVPSGF